MNPISHPTLYTKDSTGKTRVWWMDRDGSLYRTNSGVLEGQIVTSEWTEAKPKNIGKTNETTGEEQASLEIEAKYKKQLKTGYHKSIEDIEKNSYIEPLLAKQYKDYAKDIDFTKGQYLIQRKLNGNRCIATSYGLFTRKGEQYISVPHIEEQLKPYFIKKPNAILDGELYNHSLRLKLNELSSLVRKTKNITKEDLAKSEAIVQLWLYDGYGFDGLDESVGYETRWRALRDVPDYLNSNSSIRILEYTQLTSEKDFNTLYNSFIDDGEEGAILRLKSMPYEHKRSKNLLKVKPEDSDEAIVLDVMEGEGNWAKTGKIIRLQWNGKEFNATLKGTYEQAVDVLKNKKGWIGRRVTFLYNSLTGLNTPNFARVDYDNWEPST